MKLFVSLRILCLHWMLQQKAFAGVVQLTSENFDAVTAGKNIFVKFFAPWCAHCRSMAEDWSRLGEDFEGHEYTVVGEVDCTSDEGKPLCDEFEVEGFPTLIYGDPMNVDIYKGETNYESMSKFAQDRLSKPICSVFNLDNCSGEEKELVKSLMEKSIDDLESIMVDVEHKVEVAEGEFDAEVTKIQEKYDSLVKQFNDDLDTIKESYNYKYVEQILMLYHDSEIADESMDEL